MSEDQFTKLFKYMQAEFDKTHTELESKASTKLVERVIEMLDEDTKRQEDRRSRTCCAWFTN